MFTPQLDWRGVGRIGRAYRRRRGQVEHRSAHAGVVHPVRRLRLTMLVITSTLSFRVGPSSSATLGPITVTHRRERWGQWTQPGADLRHADDKLGPAYSRPPAVARPAPRWCVTIPSGPSRALPRPTTGTRLPANQRSPRHRHDYPNNPVASGTQSETIIDWRPQLCFSTPAGWWS